jgi:intracellular multiplication protein IcmT
VGTAADDTNIEKANWHWRNTMRPVRFFNLDARAVLPFCILLVYARLDSLIFTLLITGVFYMLERMGLTFPAALRAFRVFIIGKNRPGWVIIRRRVMKDYG